MSFSVKLSQLIQGQASGAPSMGGVDGLLSLVPMGLIILVMYFLLIRPANKQRQEHKKLLNALKVDDKVVTNGGICGRVVSVQNEIAILEIADKVKIRILKDRISGFWDAELKSVK